MANRFHRIYELQHIDLHEGKVSFGSHHGRLLSNDEGLRPLLGGALETEFQAFKTNGNGACAIHAVWGVPQNNGELKYEPSSGNLRGHVYALLPKTFSELRHFLCVSRTDLVQNMETFLWNELAYPGARQQGDREAALF